jgi:hypothetical protein
MLLLTNVMYLVFCSYVDFRVSVSVSAAQVTVVIRLDVSSFPSICFTTDALVQGLSVICLATNSSASIHMESEYMFTVAGRWTQKRHQINGVHFFTAH